MINFSIAVKNPWSKDRPQKNYFYREPKLSKNWAMCIQIYKSSIHNIFSLSVDTAWRGSDHAGPRLDIEVCGYCFDLNFYNTRHWDYDIGTWQKYGDKE